MKKGSSLGVTVKKEDDFSEWYIQTLTKAEFIDYTDISGCYVFRPNSYAIWEIIQKYFDNMIKENGIKNCYFPCFVSKKALETESENFEGFVPEVAWVTKSGDSDLSNSIALRPTSEAIIYPMFAKWIRSHRDLPLRLNQWCNVVRWEMKRCVPFIRSREFLWQEGHSAFATKEEADKEVYQILDYYNCVYENLLAVPVIKGIKTNKEKFAGAEYTTTIEAFVPANGRAIQAATSHSLGQNFSKAFDIKFEKELVWQNSWGLSTRSIGVMIMVHGDDKGIRMSPRIAPVQVIIIPIPNKNNMDILSDKIKEIEKQLLSADIRVQVDYGLEKPGWKYNHWETRGVPVRMEIGDNDLIAGQAVVCRRDTSAKTKIPFDDLAKKLPILFDLIHNNLYESAKSTMANRTKTVITFNEFIKQLDNKNICLVPFCCVEMCEDNIKIKSKETNIQQTDEEKELTGAAKSLCIPLEQPVMPMDTKCFGECGCDAQKWCLFGRSY